MISAKRLALAAAAAFAVGGIPAAQAGGGFGERMDNQRDRIEEGIDNGDLTRGEVRKLRRQQERIGDQRERLAEQGDGLSDQDRRKLKRRLNAQSERIYDQRHDGQER